MVSPCKMARRSGYRKKAYSRSGPLHTLTEGLIHARVCCVEIQYYVISYYLLCMIRIVPYEYNLYVTGKVGSRA